MLLISKIAPDVLGVRVTELRPLSIHQFYFRILFAAVTFVLKPVIPGCVLSTQVGFTEGPVPHALIADAEQCLVALNRSQVRILGCALRATHVG